MMFLSEDFKGFVTLNDFTADADILMSLSSPVHVTTGF